MEWYLYFFPFSDSPPLVSSSTSFNPVIVQHQNPLQNPPNTYLSLNVFACLLCCPLCGFIGIILALDSRNAAQRGDQREASRKSFRARGCGIAGIMSGIICIGFPVVIIMIVYSTFPGGLLWFTKSNPYGFS